MTSGGSDIIDIAGQIRIDRADLKAILFFDGDREVWLPRSLIEIGADGTVAMPEWLALDKELI